MNTPPVNWPFKYWNGIPVKPLEDAPWLRTP
jgi:hypothetical protein